MSSTFSLLFFSSNFSRPAQPPLPRLPTPFSQSRRTGRQRADGRATVGPESRNPFPAPSPQGGREPNGGALVQCALARARRLRARRPLERAPRDRREFAREEMDIRASPATSVGETRERERKREGEKALPWSKGRNAWAGRMSRQSGPRPIPLSLPNSGTSCAFLFFLWLFAGLWAACLHTRGLLRRRKGRKK